MASKRNSNEDVFKVTIDDDYIQLLSEQESVDEYEDIYSDSGNETYDAFSGDVYFKKNQTEDRGIYVGRKRKAFNINSDLEELSDKQPTRQVPRVASAPPKVVKNRVEDIQDEDEISDYESRYGKRKRRKKKHPFVKLLVFLLVVALAFGGLLSALSNIVAGDFVKGEEIIHSDAVGALVSDANVKNILLIGSDVESSGGSSRSDTMMIASVNSKTGKITLVSILRDTHVDIPGRGAAKINAAYSWGGVNLLIQTIEENFGIKIDDYATVNFEMFESLVEGLGGITIEVTENEANYLNEFFELGEGGKADKVQSGEKVFLNGYQTLCYARIRKLDSDFFRTERQRKIIGAIMENIKGQLNPVGMIDLAGTLKKVAPYIETTLSQPDLWSLLISLSVCAVKSGGNTDKLMVSAQLPFDGTWWYSTQWDGSSISIDLEANRTMLHELLYSDASAEETTQEAE